MIKLFFQERERYRKLQNARDEEVSILTEENNKYKRELDIQKDENEKLRRKQLETHRSTDNISMITEKLDDDIKGSIDIKFLRKSYFLKIIQKVQ